MAPVKNLPANAGDTGDAKTQVYFLSKEDPLEKETATHSSILALEVNRGAWWVIVRGVPKSRTQMSMHALDHWILSHTHNSVSVIMSPSLSLTLTDLHSSCKHPLITLGYLAGSPPLNVPITCIKVPWILEGNSHRFQG